MEKLEQRVVDLEKTISSLLQHIQDVKYSITGGFEKVTEKLDTLRGNSTASLEIVDLKLDGLKLEISLLSIN